MPYLTWCRFWPDAVFDLMPLLIWCRFLPHAVLILCRVWPYAAFHLLPLLTSCRFWPHAVFDLLLPLTLRLCPFRFRDCRSGEVVARIYICVIWYPHTLLFIHLVLIFLFLSSASSSVLISLTTFIGKGCSCASFSILTHGCQYISLFFISLFIHSSIFFCEIKVYHYYLISTIYCLALVFHQHCRKASSLSFHITNYGLQVS